MKKTKTVTLEIDSDKVFEFYSSLFSYKMSKGSDITLLKTMADAIHFDIEELMGSFSPSELEDRNIDRKLHSIHEYLLNSKNDSSGYFKVSKNNFEEFKSSPFCNDLYEFFKLKEVSKKWIGKEDSAEVKAGIVGYSIVCYYFIYHFEEAVKYSLQPEIQEKLKLQDIHDQLLKGEISENGNVQIVYEGQNVEFEFYVEQKKEIVKTVPDSAVFNSVLKKTGIFHVFMRYQKFALRIHIKKQSIEIVTFKDVQEKDNILNLTNASIISTESTPTNNIKEKNEELNIPEQKEFKFNSAAFASIYNPIEEQVTFYLANPKDKNKREITEMRDKIVISVYNSLQKHYKDLTPHVYSTITGYTCSELELLDSEEQHDNSERKLSYREYLRNSIKNILAHSKYI